MNATLNTAMAGQVTRWHAMPADEVMKHLATNAANVLDLMRRAAKFIFPELKHYLRKATRRCPKVRLISL